MDGAEDLRGLGVAEVCRRADVHRVTFYGHWISLDAAVADAFADAGEEVVHLGAIEPGEGAAHTIYDGALAVGEPL